MEIWKQIEGFNGYEVSNLGNIRSSISCYRKSKEFLILKPGKITSGYLHVMLRKEGISISKLVHRLVAENFINNISNKPFINHLNGIKSDNRLINLEWTTQSENQKHAYRNGLDKPKIGSLNGMTKLTIDQVINIKNLLKEKNKLKIKEIAEKTKSTVSDVKNIKYNRTWKHIII